MLGLDNPMHLAFLFVLLLLVFGAKRLPELGRSLGSGLRGFKETVSGESVDGDGGCPGADAGSRGDDRGETECVDHGRRPIGKPRRRRLTWRPAPSRTKTTTHPSIDPPWPR
jgi:sec-independent protein translocase protein TatA